MNDIALGVLAIVVGLAFCFRGYLAMRIVIPLWGLFSGLALGAGVVSGMTDHPFLGTALGWVVGIGIGLVFGALAYLYFEVMVMVGLVAIGFLLGSSLMVALNVTWTWVVVLVGISFGVLLGVFAIAADMPMVVLTVLTAFAGSSATLVGVMLLVGKLHTTDLDQAEVSRHIQHSPAWWIAYVVLALVGIGVQVRFLDSMRRSLRDEWDAERGARSAPAG